MGNFGDFAEFCNGVYMDDYWLKWFDTIIDLLGYFQNNFEQNVIVTVSYLE